MIDTLTDWVFSSPDCRQPVLLNLAGGSTGIGTVLCGSRGRLELPHTAVITALLVKSNSDRDTELGITLPGVSIHQVRTYVNSMSYLGSTPLNCLSH